MNGVKPEWANLPRRHCDNCGKTYKPFRPLKENERGFCQANCRKEYHKHGGSFSKLKPVVIQEIKKRVRECNPADEVRISAIEERVLRLEQIWESILPHLLKIKS